MRKRPVTEAESMLRQGLLSDEPLLPNPPVTSHATDPLGHAALTAGLITPEDLADCQREVRENVAGGRALGLEEVLLKRKILWPEDLEKLRLHARKGGAIPTATDTILQADTLFAGRYRVFEEVGVGGSARVYLAEDTQLNRPVAIKLLQSIDPMARARFHREGLVAASLDHPNIVKVFDSGEHQGRAYMCMQYVQGRALSKHELDFTASLQVIRKIALALQYAHHRQVLHRDVKPGNLLMDEAGEVYLADFGLGRETHSGTVSHTGTVLGTPAYMAPEQAKGNNEDVDARSDIYSLGATLYELLTGQPPFTGKNPFEIAEKVCRGDIRTPRAIRADLPRDVEWVVLKAMAYDREQRYTSAQEFADDLQRCLDGESVLAHPPSVAYRVSRWARRRRAVALSALIAGTLVGGVLWFTLGSESYAIAPERLPDLWCFRDALAQGWYRNSWEGESSICHDVVHEGTSSIRCETTDRWGGLVVGPPLPIRNAADFEGLEFYIRVTGHEMSLSVEMCAGQEPDKIVLGRTDLGAISTTEWQRIFIPMRVLNPELKPFEHIILQSDCRTVFHVDDLRLVGAPVSRTP